MRFDSFPILPSSTFTMPLFAFESNSLMWIPCTLLTSIGFGSWSMNLLLGYSIIRKLRAQRANMQPATYKMQLRLANCLLLQVPASHRILWPRGDYFSSGSKRPKYLITVFPLIILLP